MKAEEQLEHNIVSFSRARSTIIADFNAVVWNLGYRGESNRWGSCVVDGAGGRSVVFAVRVGASGCTSKCKCNNVKNDADAHAEKDMQHGVLLITHTGM